MPTRRAIPISEWQTVQACAMEGVASKRSQTRQPFITEGFAFGRDGRCMRSNEIKSSDGYRNRASNRSGSVLLRKMSAAATMLFKELIEQHCVHLIVANGVGFALRITHD
jgi:hypothetical protein